MDMNDHSPITPQEPITHKKNHKPFLKSILLTLISGAVGAGLTLAAVPHIDFFEDLYGNNGIESSAFKESPQDSGPIATKTSTKANSGDSIADIVEKASKSIVGVVNIQQQQNYFSHSFSGQNVKTGTGSGVIINKSADGIYIVTNNHVVEGAKTIEVSLANGKKVVAELVGADALSDIAVLKIDGKHDVSIMDFGDSSILRPGDQVLAIGNPLGLDLSRTVTQGIVSAIDRSISVSTSAGEWDMNVIQTDAAINPGNSGGALINTEGQVIGINSLKISDDGVEGLGFAIPSNEVVPIVNEIIKSGKVARPYMGVSLADIAEMPRYYSEGLPNDVTAGTMVMDIDPNSAAAKAGLEVKDVIVSINNQKVETANGLRSYLYSKLKVGDKVTLEVYRNGKLKKIELKLAEK